MARRTGPMLALSLGVHAALLGGLFAGASARPARVPLPEVRSIAPAVRAPFEAASRAVELRRRREVLVREARAERAEHRLALGAFLLATSRIDAEEAGIELDGELAARRYGERVEAVRAALAKKPKGGVGAVVPAVFGDLKYYGQPGGLMASALVDSGGSCEQVSQLVGAAVHDAGRPNEIALRYYGGVMEDGASHITPVALTKDGELDLMTGMPAMPGGVRVEVEDLVEVYARAHGLGEGTGARVEPVRSAQAAGRRKPAGRARPTIVAGLPGNADRFPGSLPLYAARALRDPTGEPPAVGEPQSLEMEARHCAYFLRIAMLAPPSIEVVTGGASGAVSVEPRRVPPPLRLEREAVLLRAAETVASRAETDPVDRLMGWACLAVLGESAAVDFALAREHGLAAEAIEASKRGRAEGALSLAAIPWSGDEGERAAQKLALDYGGRAWILLALPGGERVVKDLVVHAKRDNWGRINALGALVVWQGTREWAVSYTSTLPLTDQVDVMHEVFHAHDHMRPWASTFDLDDTPATTDTAREFLNVYGVFRGLAWRLWEGQRPVEETLAALDTEAQAAGIDRAWHAALLRYFAHNTLGLYSQRRNGKVVLPLLRAAVDKSTSSLLDPVRRTLAYLEAEQELNARTVADAMRQR
ncbi:MAG: hypothetical protein R3B70_02285 [Polyangiaceae bacterium]